MNLERLLQNTGAVRNLCQDICCELDDLSSNQMLNNDEQNKIKSYYENVKTSIEKLTNLGFFNKSDITKDKKQIIEIILSIFKTEEQASDIVKNVWAKEITDVNEFNQNNFKLCVKRLPYDLKNLEKIILQAFNDKPVVYSANLISNLNLSLNQNSIEEDNLSLPFGIVYGVTEQSFVMASDKSCIFSLKQKDFEVNDMQEAVFGDIKACIKGNAVKIKTPQQIINKNLKNPLFVNNNSVVLDAKTTKPVAIFCYGYNIKKINLLRRKLSFIAKKINVPIINISLLKFYRNNKNYFVNNAISRKVFNSFVDTLLNDLNLYTKYDFKNGAKRLIGLNSNLRYNFLYKFTMNINNFLDGKDMSESDTSDYIVEMFLKAVEKHNALTKKREKANGAPLFFPNEKTFIALPKDFLREE